MHHLFGGVILCMDTGTMYHIDQLEKIRPRMNKIVLFLRIKLNVHPRVDSISKRCM